MKKFNLTITLQAEDENQAAMLHNCLTKATEKIDAKDLIKLCNAIVKKPSLVKTAVSFI